jgi:hypothetical protein
MGIPLEVGDNTISIELKAGDQVINSYTLLITRGDPATDAALSQLTLSSGTLDPGFDPATFAYTAEVAYNVGTLTITATPADTHATVSGDTGVKTVNVGENTFSIVVTAEDGIETNTYTVVVTRNNSVSIKEVGVSPVRFFVKDRIMEVENAEGMITITSLTGISQKYIAQGSITKIPVGSGIYILTVNGVSYKVSVN